MIFCNFFDYSRTKIVARFHWSLRLILFLFVLLDVLVYANLLSHNALNIDFLWIVIIFKQRYLDGLLETFRVHRQLLLGNHDIQAACHVHLFRCCPRRKLLLLNSNIISLSCLVVSWHLVLLCNDLSMGFSSWESIHVLFNLVSKHVRILTKEGLCTHYFHWHNCVQLTLKFLFGTPILLI